MIKRHIALANLKVSNKAKQYVLQALNNNRLSYGPFTEKFEQGFAKMHHRKYALITNSGTSGLQVGLHALREFYGWEDQDEVLVPAITFIASSNTIIQNNLKPVFVDVEPDFYCIDPKKIKEKITNRTRAIMPVHLFGQSADMDPILKIAKKYNLKIIEDSCEAMFVNYNKHPIGSMGDISVFSTYIAHILTTGVGGMITTNDEQLATIMRSLMFHGRDNIYLKIEDDDTTNKIKLNSLIERRFQFIHVGYSYRLTEMEGALGLAELEDKDRIIKRRQTIGRKISQALGEFSKYIQIPKVRPNSEHIYMLFPLVIKNPKIDRDNLLLYLEENGIETRLFMPLLSQPIYKKIFGDIEEQYPISKKLVNNGFIIGSHLQITNADINYLYNLFKNYIRRTTLKKL